MLVYHHIYVNTPQGDEEHNASDQSAQFDFD